MTLSCTAFRVDLMDSAWEMSWAYSSLYLPMEASNLTMTSLIFSASCFLTTAALSRDLSSCLRGSTLLNMSEYSSWAMHHLTMGPQAKLALLTFSKLKSGLDKYLSSITFLMSSEICSVSKLTMDGMKFSFMVTALIAFQSGTFSPSSVQIASKAILIICGGFAIVLTSTRCCFLIFLTASWASMTAGSTLSRSFMTSLLLDAMSLVCCSTSLLISMDCCFCFSASC